MDFKQFFKSAYSPDKASINLGAARKQAHIYADIPINIPLSTLNRHGLIAGATGTGKTKTIQIIAEQLSDAGVPVMVMDVKGDLSGIAIAGEKNPATEERQKHLNLPYTPQGFPTELLSLTTQPGVRVRATVNDFGSILFAKMLALNETQSSILSILFKYAEDQKLPLLDLQDVKRLLQYAMAEGKEEISKQYGYMATGSLTAILRAIVELEAEGGTDFFSEPAFAIQDLMRTNAAGKGIISVLRLLDLQEKPNLFSTFMLGLLSELYRDLPEVGDLEKPKLIFVIDEAHLLFKEASSALLDKIDTIIKLIRSKGVGIIFSTQAPTDIPANVLSQLGLKVQHALRAFTAKDRKDIQKISENYPISEYYDVKQLLTELGIGEALVTALDVKGRPTPVVNAYLRAPMSRMGALTDQEIQGILATSQLVGKYQKTLARESAYEILKQRLPQPETTATTTTTTSEKPSTLDKTLQGLSKNTMVRQMARTFMKELVRTITTIFVGKGKK